MVKAAIQAQLDALMGKERNVPVSEVFVCFTFSRPIASWRDEVLEQ